MALSQLRSKRKPSGGRYKPYRKKKLYELGNEPTHTRLGPMKAKTVRVTGGMMKQRVLTADKVNVYDPQTKKYAVLAIKTISDNPANRHFIRRNIITKGAVVDTEKGKARVTSRPAQDGVVNAVLVR